MTTRLRILLLIAASTLVYANTLRNSFTYDDFLYVLNNPLVTNPSLHSFFSTTQFSNVFRPLTFASFSFNWVLGSIHAVGYHLLNLILHAAVVVLLYLLLRKLLENFDQAETIALVAAALFAVHPIHTEAVASIAGRSELLAAGFLFAAWLLHLHDHWIPALLCFLLAMMGKESAVVFVPLVFFGDYARAKWKPIARYVCIAGVAALYAAVLWKAQGAHFGEHGIAALDNILAGLPARLRILNALRVAWKYVALQIFPLHLSYDYSYNAIPVYRDWTHTLPALLGAIAVLALWLWAFRTGRRPWVLAGAIYFAGFATTANLLLPIGTIMGERLAYLPSAGFCLLVALLWSRAEKYRPQLAWGFLILILAALGSRTILRNRDWRTNFTLYSSAYNVVPDDARMHANLGGFYMDSGQLDRAQSELQTALRIYPPFPDALEFSGLVESRLGHDEAALPFLEQAFSYSRQDSPSYVPRAVNLAAMLVKLGKDDNRALDLLNEAIVRSPDNSRAWSNRAVIHYRHKDLPAARADAQTALQLDPQSGQARSLLTTLNVNPANQSSQPTQ
jgi:protein O-mannosyl-transferase